MSIIYVCMRAFHPVTLETLSLAKDSYNMCDIVLNSCNYCRWMLLF